MTVAATEVLSLDSDVESDDIDSDSDNELTEDIDRQMIVEDSFIAFKT